MPGTGSRTASAGRCTPWSRRRPKVAAAIVGAGRAGADHRVGGVLGDVAGGAHDRGLPLGAHRRHRVLVVADPLAGRHHLDSVDPVEVEAAAGTEDTDANAAFGGAPGALGEHLEALLGPVPVEGHGDAAAPRRHGYSESEEAAGVSATLCEMTSRPA